MGEKIADRRIERTRQLLREALLALILEKGYGAVTVQDIIDRANVGRSTFYAHFRDQEDLFLSGFESMRAQFEQHLTSQATGDAGPWSLSLMMFQHAQSHHQLYKALVGKQGGNLMLTQIHKYLLAIVQGHMKAHWLNRKEALVPPNVLAHYIVSSFMALLTWWLDNNLPYSAERMNEMYRQLTEPGVMAVMGDS
jgi:AcrR family transcriptional regulator